MHKIKCMIHAEQKLIENEIENELQNTNEDLRYTSDCSCLPACTSISYSAEILQTSFDWKSRSAAFKSFDDPERLVRFRLSASKQITTIFSSSKISGLSVTFKRPKFMVSKQSVVFGKTDFFASCGGLLGLFMGISVIGCFKRFHFCTIQMIRFVLWLCQKIWYGARLVLCRVSNH